MATTSNAKSDPTAFSPYHTSRFVDAKAPMDFS